MSCRRDGRSGNGRVERANRTEFWNFLGCELTVQAVSAKLLLYEFFYNYERPHAGLDYLTPNEYLVARPTSHARAAPDSAGSLSNA